MAPNRRTRGSDNNDGRATIDLERPKAEDTLQSECPHMIFFSPLATTPGSTVSEMAAAPADTVLSAAAETAPRTKCKRGPKGWCASEEVKRKIHESWGKREATRQQQCGAPTDTALRRKLKSSTDAERVMSEFFEEHATQLEKRSRKGDKAGFYRHMDGLDVGVKRRFTSWNIEDEDGQLLRDPALIRERWARLFHKPLNTRPPTLDPRTAEQAKQWPKCVPLDYIRSRFEVEKARRGVTIREAPGPNRLPAELIKPFLDEDQDLL